MAATMLVKKTKDKEISNDGFRIYRLINDYIQRTQCGVLRGMMASRNRSRIGSFKISGASTEKSFHAANSLGRIKALLALILLIPVQSLATIIFFWCSDAIICKSFIMICRLWLLFLPILWLKFMDHGEWSWSPPKLGGFRTATFSGLIISAVIFSSYMIAGRLGVPYTAKILESAARTGLNRPAVFIAAALYWITCNSLIEEYLWRWFAFRKFEVLLGGKRAVAATALAFTAHHVLVLAAQFHWIIVIAGSSGVFLGGMIWSRLYMRYRSVWPCYLSHAIVDASIFIVGYRLIFSGQSTVG